jgi:methyl-accepting chemotaxis protein
MIKGDIQAGGELAMRLAASGGSRSFPPRLVKDWTIKKRIALGFASILMLTALVGAAGLLAISRIEAHFSAVVDDALPGVTLAGKIKSLVAQRQLDLLCLLNAKTPAESRHYEEDAAACAGTVLKSLQAFQGTVFRADDRQAYQKVADARGGYNNLYDDALADCRAGRTNQALAKINLALQPAFTAYLTALDELFEANAQYGQLASQRVQGTTRMANWTVTGLTLLAVLAGAALAWAITGGLNRLLHRVAGEIDRASEEISLASGQISCSGQTLAQGASEQAASLEETSASLEEIASMTRRNAEHADHAKKLAAQTRSAADTGFNDMREMSQAMDAIKSSSNNIGKIIKTIDEIAFQTNILALNAAVEAARAGEAGMGFAVVADEVRNLAQRSAQAARETADKIQDSITRGQHGVDISAKVAASLHEIVEKARTVDELLGQIAAASAEQSQGIAQVNSAVNQLDQVTQTNAGSAEENAGAAENLNTQAAALKSDVGALARLVGRLSRPSSRPPLPSNGAAAPHASDRLDFPALGRERRPLSARQPVHRAALAIEDGFKEF